MHKKTNSRHNLMFGFFFLVRSLVTASVAAAAAGHNKLNLNHVQFGSIYLFSDVTVGHGCAVCVCASQCKGRGRQKEYVRSQH